jgi:hypothetical protein
MPMFYAAPGAAASRQLPILCEADHVDRRVRSRRRATRLGAMRTVVAAFAIVFLAMPAAARAQGGDGQVGGTVSSYLELRLSQPAKGFAAFTKARSYQMSLRAQATATDGQMVLSIADGDATGGSKRGHLAVGSKRLSSPLEARVGKAAFQPLAASVDPLLTRWRAPLSNAEATIKLRQRVSSKATGRYHKVVLVTLSSETP